MKRILLLFISVTFICCPWYHEAFFVTNKSNGVIYVYLSYSDSLPQYPELTMKGINKGGYIATRTILPDSTESLLSLPSPKLRYDKVNLFVVTESTMKKYIWKRIWHDQMYEKKITFTQKDLDEINWHYVYW